MATTRTATAPRQSETPVIMRTTPAGIWDALLSDICEGLFISYALMLTATCTHSVTYGSTCNIDLYRHSNNTENRIFMMMMMMILKNNTYKIIRMKIIIVYDSFEFMGKLAVGLYFF